MLQATPALRPNMFPFFRYRDAWLAIRWLESAFGFERLMVVPANDGGVAHAELRLGAGVIMVGSTGDPALGMASPRDLPAVNQGLYVHVDDIAAHYARARESGAEIVRPLNATDYGSQEYTARDLEGHLWSFGTYDPLAALE